MSRPVVVLGATGSIGTQKPEVAARLNLDVVGVAARRPSPQFAEVVRNHRTARAVVVGGSSEEREEFVSTVGRPIDFSSDAVLELASTPDAVIVNGIVGAAGLRATIAGLEAGNRVALANKESMGAGGPVVKKSIAGGSGEIVPVDSEHSALHQLLLGEPTEAVARLMLTASGGPFRG